MSRKERNAGLLFLLVIICPLMFYYFSEKVIHKSVVKRTGKLVSSEFLGIVSEKYIDEEYRMNKVIKIDTNGADRLFELSESYCHIRFDTIWRKINVGDSLLKRKNQYKLMKVKNGVIVDTFWLVNYR